MQHPEQLTAIETPTSSVNFLRFNEEYTRAMTESGVENKFPWLVDTRMIGAELLRQQFAGSPLVMSPEEILQLACFLGPKAEALLHTGITMPVIIVDESNLTDPEMFLRIVESEAFGKSLRKSSGVLQIAGGAAGLDMPALQIDQLVATITSKSTGGPIHDIYHASSIIWEMAYQHQLAIVNGGTQSGIMAGISAVHAVKTSQMALLHDGLDRFFHSFGSSRGLNAFSELQLPPILQMVPGKTVLIPGYSDEEYQWGKYAVAPGSVVFVFKGKEFGGEARGIEHSANRLAYVPSMEALTTSLQQKVEKADSRRLLVVVNGGGLTLDEVRNALMGVDGNTPSNVKIIILNGTGRSADKLALLVSNPSLTIQDLIAQSPNLEKDDLKKESYQHNLQRTADLLRHHARRGQEEGRLFVSVINTQDHVASYTLNGVVNAMMR